MPAFSIAVGIVLGLIVRLGQQRVEVGRIRETVGVTLHRGTEAGGRILRKAGAELLSVGGQGRDLVYLRVEGEGSVIDQQVLSAFANEVGIADAVACANYRSRLCLEGESNAGCEVVLLHVD